VGLWGCNVDKVKPFCQFCSALVLALTPGKWLGHMALRPGAYCLALRPFGPLGQGPQPLFAPGMKLKLEALLVAFLKWRIRHMSSKNFVLILSAVIGAIAGVAAVTLKEAVHLIQEGLRHYVNGGLGQYLYFFLPLVGIMLTVFIAHYILKEQLGHGITDILFAISKKSSLVQRSKTYSRMITSAITVGLGGSVGLEAPIVVTGSAIGSNMGRVMHLNYKQRTLLIGCGAAGAISAIFDSPIAGVIFSIEVILAEVTIAAFIPLLIASVGGALVSLSLMGGSVLFAVNGTQPFLAANAPYYLLLGVVCGLVSVYFTRIMYRVERWVGTIKKRFLRALLGGLALAFLVFLLPPIYGEGYDTINMLLNGQQDQIFAHSVWLPTGAGVWVLLVGLLGVVLIKPAATALTIGSGGSGGIFAPSLFLGGVTGFLFSYALNLLVPEANLNTANFTLVGMCGVMSGVLFAPLTAIFLIAEITSGYTLFVPLMLVSAIAYNTGNYFEKFSLYTKRLHEQGILQNDKDKQVLSMINMKKLIETDLLTISYEATLGDLVDLVRMSNRNIFPVLDQEGQLLGIVTLDDIRQVMFDEESRKNVKIKSLMHAPPAIVSMRDAMTVVMNKFERTGAWNLPVIDDGKYVGFVSKSRIFNTYRQKLIYQND